MAEQAVRDRLDDLIRRSGEDYASLSRRIGRNPAYIQQFIKRGVPRRLNEVDRRALARHFNVPESFLGAPEGRPLADLKVEPQVGDTPALVLSAASAAQAIDDQARSDSEGQPERPAVDFLLVPFLAPPNGRSGNDATGTAARTLAFDVRVARELASQRVSALRALRVDSDSMLPTLAAGDEVLLDCDDRTRLRDGIYAILSEGAMLIKRVSVHPVTKRLSVISDNPAYPSFADCDPDLVRVIGRVVWVGRRLA
ncbi:MAG: helix-turn-helix transcriptional regulator [Thermaurantiacus sp.]